MKDFKNYIRPITIFALVISLILIFSYLSSDGFRAGTENYSKPALFSTNTITELKLSEQLSEGSVIFLEREVEFGYGRSNESLIIDPGQLVDKKTLKAIKELPAPRIIVSKNIAMSAQVWMILAQKGIKDIYLPGEPGNEETFKYKFRPDTSVSN